jgi:hypothetical protein
MELHDKIKARADNKAKVHSRQADNYVESNQIKVPKGGETDTEEFKDRI